MKSYIGIDFGACNLKAAKIFAKGRLQKIKLNKDLAGGNFSPNAILYDKVRDKIEVKVGKVAKNSFDDDNVVRQIKPKLAQKNWSKFIANLGRRVDAAEVVKNIFEWLWREITIKFSKDEELEVAITAPVSFSEVQKNLIRQAAEAAGIPVKAVLSEPFAAIFSAEDFDDEEQCILIFDFGGSTLDVSLCRIENNDELHVTELAAAGLKFGGIDIDNAIFEQIFLTKYADDVKNFIGEDTTGRFKNELMNLIEKLKEEIFINDEDESCDFVPDARGNMHEFSLTRDEVHSVLEKLGVKEKILALLDALLDDAQLDARDVTQVKLFGGTSAIDFFRKILTDYFDENIFGDEEHDPEEIYMGVADGAARFLFMKNEQPDITIENVIPYGIGLVSCDKFTRLIKRNELSGFVTPYKPLLVSELNQNDWRVAVYQTFSDDFDLPADNEDIIFLGDVALDRKLYSATDAILFKMQPSGSGEIFMTFFEQLNAGDAPSLVEKKTVTVGG